MFEQRILKYVQLDIFEKQLYDYWGIDTKLINEKAYHFASVSEWSKEFDSSSNLVRGMGSNPIGSTF